MQSIWNKRQFILCLIIHSCGSVSSICRNSRFSFTQGATTTYEGYRLQGYVIEIFNTPSIVSCGMLCLRNSRCVSTNFALAREEHEGLCEMNRAGISKRVAKIILVKDDRFVFSQYGITKEENYDCWMHPPYQKDYSLEFPSIGVTDSVIVRNLPALESFSVCLWMISKDTTSNGTLISLATEHEDNEIRVYNYQNFVLSVGGRDTSDLSLSANDGKWHQICATWENKGGSWTFYKDGIVANGGTSFKQGYIIESGGVLVVGQEQAYPGGGFDPQQAFVGSITNVNMWDHLLSNDEITLMNKSCLSGEGNILNWVWFQRGVQGRVRIVTPTTCEPLP